MTTSYSMYVPDENVDYEWGVQAIDNGKRGGKFAKSDFNPTTTGLKKKRFQTLTSMSQTEMSAIM